MSLNLRMPQVTELKPKIMVFGVGGAGGNGVNNMINAALEGVEFVVANTDAQALSQNLCERGIQIGADITQGLGAGSRPEVGAAAAEESLEEIMEQLAGSHMTFITAGMGGGTGTGAAPVIARASRDQGILTVGVVTKPFDFEGQRRMRIAEQGIEELQKYVDTLIIIPNQNLFRVANEKTTFADAFAMADEVLHSGVRGITDLMVMPGLINLDFADVRTVMNEMGKAMMGTGEAEGDTRAIEAAEAAINNPLLDEVSMKGARGVLINITGGDDLTLYEVDEAANRIRSEVDQDANIIVGSTFNEALTGRMRVSIVATGIEAAEDIKPQTRPAERATVHAPKILQRMKVGPAHEEVAAQEEWQPAASAIIPDEQDDRIIETDGDIDQRRVNQGTLLLDNEVEVTPGGEIRDPEAAPVRQRLRFEDDEAIDRREAPVRKRQVAPARKPSLIERVTGIGRPKSTFLERQEPAQRRPEPQRPVSRPSADADEALFPESAEESDLDIPAFLRRQAN
jgi:cell division protein FtsZ